MDCMNRNSATPLLRQASAEIDDFLERFGKAPVLGRQEEVDALYRIKSAVTAVGDVLPAIVRSQDDPEVSSEITGYRGCLVRLREELARMQAAALLRREHLLTGKSHLSAAQAWCDTAQEILR